MSIQASSQADDDIEFVMDNFQRSIGKPKPVRDPQIQDEVPEEPQCKEPANSFGTQGFGEIV